MNTRRIKKQVSWKLRQAGLMLMLALVIAPVLGAVLPMMVHAEEWPDSNDSNAIVPWTKLENYMGKKNMGLNWNVAALLGYSQRVLVGGNLKGMLTWTQGEVDFALILWDSFKMLGICLGIVYFLLEMNHAVYLASSNWTMQSLMTPIIKFGVVFFMIGYGGNLVGGILSLGNWVIGKVTEGTNTSTGLTVQMCEQIKQLGFIECILMFLPIIIMVITSFIISLVFVYKTFSYKLEVLIRVAITPIVFGDLWDGRNSHAIRWLKKLAGLMLYGACFILILQIGYSTVISTMINDYAATDTDSAYDIGMSAVVGIWALLKGTLFSFLVPIAEIGALSLAKNACMEVFG